MESLLFNSTDRSLSDIDGVVGLFSPTPSWQQRSITKPFLVCDGLPECIQDLCTFGNSSNKLFLKDGGVNIQAVTDVKDKPSNLTWDGAPDIPKSRRLWLGSDFGGEDVHQSRDLMHEFVTLATSALGADDDSAALMFRLLAKSKFAHSKLIRYSDRYNNKLQGAQAWTNGKYGSQGGGLLAFLPMQAMLHSESSRNQMLWQHVL